MQPPQFTAPLIDTKTKSTQLDSIYNPQTQFIQSQIDLIPTYYEPQKAALEQAKVNAFRDIGNTAQSRGMFFSGFQPHEQARYLGEKYLPALAGYDMEMQRERQGLLGQIVGLNADRGQQMLGYYDKNDDRTYDAAQTNYGTNVDWWNTQQNWSRDDIVRAEDQAFQRELIELEAATAAKYAPRYSSGGGSYYGSSSGSSADKGDDVISYMNKWFSVNQVDGSQPTRQQQDLAIDAYMDAAGLNRNETEARQQVWNLVNSYYNRNPDPTKDPFWRP